MERSAQQCYFDGILAGVCGVAGVVRLVPVRVTVFVVSGVCRYFVGEYDVWVFVAAQLCGAADGVYVDGTAPYLGLVPATRTELYLSADLSGDTCVSVSLFCGVMQHRRKFVRCFLK